MAETFAEMFKQSLADAADMRHGSIIGATVLSIEGDQVLMGAGLKSEYYVHIDQFKDNQGQLEINVGDVVDVAVEEFDRDGSGETPLSREKAKRAEAWIQLEKAHEDNAVIKGVINGRVKGGFTVEVNLIRAFLPGSLLDLRPVRDPAYLEGKELEFKVIKIDKKRNNVVVSRRSVLEAETSAEREALLENLQEGQEVIGVVKNLTDYGAFVDLGGIDGLLHITDMAWKRVKHPSELVNVGDELKVKVLRFDRDRNRVSLGMKQLGEDPWMDLTRRYPEGSRLFGAVTNITDYGCFVEIEEGVEGLVHVSEMDWTNKNVHPNKLVSINDEVEVMVLDIDEKRRRISLGIKQCVANPWEAFMQTHVKGDHIKGVIKSITDFGIFIGLDGNIDGLVHISDISWEQPGEEAIRDFKKGDEIEVVVLSVDAERERISLGLKQMEDDPFADFLEANEKGEVVSGVIAEVTAEGITVDLDNDTKGYIIAAETAEEPVEDITTEFKVGDELSALLTGVDRKAGTATLSIRAKLAKPKKKKAAEPVKPAPIAKATLGDFFKDQISADDKQE